MSKILILGILPPPIGGITIHLSRLLQVLRDKSICYDFFDYKKDSLLNGLKKIITCTTIHINFCDVKWLFIATLFFRILNKKVIITFHGKYSFSSVLEKLTLHLSSFNFVLNNFCYDHALTIVKADKLQIISAFIPPLENEFCLSNSIREKIDKFIQGRKNVACTNAHSYVQNENGYDLYGIDFLLNVFSELPETCLIISDPSTMLKRFYYKNVQLIPDNILFISEPHSFIEVIKKSDVLVRATTRDGDSLSIREALFYGIKVIASDCIDRPLECVIYRTGNKESFINALTECQGIGIECKRVIKDSTEQIVQLYELMSK